MSKFCMWKDVVESNWANVLIFFGGGGGDFEGIPYSFYCQIFYFFRSCPMSIGDPAHVVAN